MSWNVEYIYMYVCMYVCMYACMYVTQPYHIPSKPLHWKPHSINVHLYSLNLHNIGWDLIPSWFMARPIPFQDMS